MLLKKVLPIILLVIICINHSIAQQAKLNWLADAKSYLNGGGIFVNDFEVDSIDKSTVIVGDFERTVDFDPGPDTFNLTAVSERDIFVAKYSLSGKLIYAYNFGGDQNTLIETAYSVAIDNHSNTYITGTFGKTIDFDPGPGVKLLSAPTSNEIFVVSFDALGVFRYAINIADNDGSNAVQSGKSIAVDTSQNIYVAGTFSGKNTDFDPGPDTKLFTAKGGLNIFLAKYDKYGKYIFNDVMYGDGKDDINKLKLDHHNNIVLCGFYKSSKIDFDPGPDSAILTLTYGSDIFFSKYDKNGKYIFAKKIGGSRFEQANSLAIAKDNSIALVGTFQGKNVDFDPGNDIHLLSSLSDNDIFFSRYDKNGNYIFAHSVPASGYDQCNDVTITKSGNITIIGQLSGYQADFDPGPDTFYLYRKGYYSVSYTAQYSLSGDFIFAATLDGTQSYCNSIASDDNNIIIAGIYTGELDVDPSKDSTKLNTPYSSSTMFLSVYNAKGKYVSSFSADNYINFYNSGTSVIASTTDNEGNIYTCGNFDGVFDFDPGSGTLYLNSAGNYNGETASSFYYTKYSKDGKLIFAKALIGAGGFVHDMAIDKDENIYLTGKYYNLDLDPSDKVYTIKKIKYVGYFISKYDKNGSFVFATGEQFISPNDNNVFKSIEIDSKNNICISGWFSTSLDFDPSAQINKLTPTGHTDIFFARYDALGSLKLLQSIGTAGSVCAAKDLKISRKDEFIVSGIISTAPADFNPGPGKKILHTNSTGVCGFVAKYTAEGQLGFAFDLEPSSGEYYLNDELRVSYDSSSNILTAGYFGRDVDFDPGDKIYTLPKGELFFASYTSKGDFNFAKCITNPPQFTAYTNNLSSIAADKQGSIYIAGYFFTSYIDCNPDSLSVAILKNEIFDGNTNSEIFLAQYDSNGNYVNCFNPNADSAAGSNYTSDILVTKDNGVVLSGTVFSKTDFDPSTGSVFLQPTSVGGNLFIAKYSQTGNALQENVPIAKGNEAYNASALQAVFNSPSIKRVYVFK